MDDLGVPLFLETPTHQYQVPSAPSADHTVDGSEIPKAVSHRLDL